MAGLAPASASAARESGVAGPAARTSAAALHGAPAPAAPDQAVLTPVAVATIAKVPGSTLEDRNITLSEYIK